MTQKPITIDTPLTMGELEYVEEYTGRAIEGALADPNAPKMKFMNALITVLKRRDDDKWTIKDTKKLAVLELEKLLDLSDDATLLALGLGQEVEVETDDPKSE